MMRSDNPIKSKADDLLGRDSAANHFVHQVLSLDCSEGLVVAVLGEWGSGKTSFVNLARQEFAAAEIPILDFNPWMFSGAEQLITSFFFEISAQLKLRPGLTEVGERLEDYGDILAAGSWLPVVGPWLQRGRGALKAISGVMNRRKLGIDPPRQRVVTALSKLQKPVAVIVDDIDRLTTTEIRDIFKLVRLTASFPNLVYVLAFDRVRVEQALAEQGIPGRDYLEKILQLGVDLPAVPEQVMQTQILAAINEAIELIPNPGPFDEGTWPDVFVEVIRPCVKSMRDVRRYAAAIHGTASSLNGEVALVDLLALEAVRVFLPSVFSYLPNAVEGLTTPSSNFYGNSEPSQLKDQVTQLLSRAEDDAPVIRAMIERLFPPAQRHIGGSHYGSDFQGGWLRKRRIAHEEILRLYLQKVGSPKLQSFLDAERARAVIHDEEAFDRFLRSLNKDSLEDVIASLETFEDEFDDTTALPGVVVLLNLLPEIPERERGMLGFDARTVVGRVTYRLLRSAGDPKAIEAVARAAVTRVKSLSGQLELITDVGHREGAGHKLIAESTAAELEKAWRDRVRSAAPLELAEEPELLRLMLRAKREAATDEPPLQVPDVPELTWALLRSAKTYVRSQPMGSRSVRQHPRLIWEGLVEIVGSESNLKGRVQGLSPARDGDEELLELVGKYLGGWRPSDFGDE